MVYGQDVRGSSECGVGSAELGVVGANCSKGMPSAHSPE